MTNQEAINLLSVMTDLDEKSADTIVFSKKLRRTVERQREAKKLAIAALEKQEPMKPKEDNMHRCCCPSCGNIIAQFDHGHYLDEYFPHCEYCGQAIDWTELLEEKGLIE